MRRREHRYDTQVVGEEDRGDGTSGYDRYGREYLPMLTCLALCARHGVRVPAYADAALGTMREEAGGGGRFEEVILRPMVTVASAGDVEAAARLHDRAHELCFIANSCRVVHHEAVVQRAEEARA
jgi:hypothetical protein